MMKSATGVALVGMLATTACVPMEQASLTYSSKTTMGVGVAAGTQDTPGLEVTIGFKETNVALVPVAVAKYCYKASEALCQNAIYRMRMIAGGKTDLVDNTAIEAGIEDIDAKLEKLVSDQSLDTKSLGDQKALIKNYEDANAAQLKLDKLPDKQDDESPELTSERDTLTAKANSGPAASFDILKARDKVAGLEANLSGYAEKIETYQDRRAKLSAQLATNSNSRRNDSFSVYGKFNGGATGDNKGAGLTVGKIFATGIAAQNLTEFATTADCLANIAFLAKMIPDDKAADRVALLTTAGQVCRTK